MSLLICMRLITHTDLDGVMCAALICSVEQVDEIKYIDPGTIQAGKLPVTKYDIISDLPFDRRAGMWFDHHESNRPRGGITFEGAFEIAPSAARVVFEYYENPYLDKFAAALAATDEIDSGKVPLGQARKPTGWFLLSNTLEMSVPKIEDDRYRDHVVKLLMKNPDIGTVLADPKVAARAKNVEAELAKFEEILKEHTKMIGKVAFSDLRTRPDLPRGNNYLVYSLFPEAVTSVRILPLDEDKAHVKISVGHNIYGTKSTFDVGATMKAIGGGGHRSVGGASVPVNDAEAIALSIVEKINAHEKEAH